MTAITVDRLSKSYGDIQALQDVSFDVEEGTIFGFLGPNGAGKSTTIGIMLQFLYADKGSIQIFGEDVVNNPQLKKRIGIIPDADLPKINGLKLLRHTGRYYGFRGQALRSQISRVVKLTGVREYLGRSTASLSKGQKTRVKIANALVSDPDLLIADEPTSGLDPFARRDFLQLITNLVEDEHRTVFFSSHVIGEVEKVCDELVILNRGRVVAKGSLEEISSHLPTSNSFAIRATGLSVPKLKSMSDVIGVERMATDHYIVETSVQQGTPPFLRELIRLEGVIINAFYRESMDLEQVFLQTVEESGN